MTFADWIKSRGLTYAAAADAIGAASPAVAWRYAQGRAIPTREMIGKIFEATNGSVTPNDFYFPGPSSPSCAADYRE